jgi:hypothetical protein
MLDTLFFGGTFVLGMMLTERIMRWSHPDWLSTGWGKWGFAIMLLGGFVSLVLCVSVAFWRMPRDDD